MLLTTLTNTSTTLDSTFVDFSIKQTPLMFDILSNKLYTNPILAIVRELLTNAYDAQVVNGNPDTPIDVQVPDYINEDFIIRDYGTGLSKQDMVELYTTFFDSTKSSDNNLTGGFGLGSKTPFAYTDSFIVHSYFEQEKTSYVVFKNNGMPTLTEIGSKPTTEPNGLQICITVNSTDYGAFKSAICLFHKFNREVILKDFEVSEDVLVKDNISIHPIEDTLPSICFKQGQNVFAVPFDILKHTQKLQDLHDAINDTNAVCVIEVPIGTLSISPNRESFQVNEDVIEHLSKYIENLNDGIYDLMLSAKEDSFIYPYLFKLKVKKYIPFPELSVYNDTVEVRAIETSNFSTAQKGLRGSAFLNCRDPYTISYQNLSHSMHVPVHVSPVKKFIFIIDRERKATKGTLRTLTTKLCKYYDTPVETFVPDLDSLEITYSPKGYYNYPTKTLKDTNRFIKDYHKLLKALKEHLDYDVELVTYKSLQRRIQAVKVNVTAVDDEVQKSKRIRVGYLWPKPRYCTPSSGLFDLDNFRNDRNLIDVVISVPKGVSYKTHILKWANDNIRWLCPFNGKIHSSLDTYIRKQYTMGEDTGIRLVCVGTGVIKTVKNNTNAIILDEQDYLNSLNNSTPLPHDVMKGIYLSKTLTSRINYLFKNSKYKDLVFKLPEVKSLLSYANRDLDNAYACYKNVNKSNHYLFDRPHIRKIMNYLDTISTKNPIPATELRSYYSEARRALAKLKQTLQEMVHENYS